MAGTVAPDVRPERLPQRYAVLIATIPAIMLFIIDGTVVNVALARLGAAFGVGVSTVQWVISAFALGVGVSTPLASYLERRYTTKVVWLFALTLFTGSSMVCGLAPTFLVMVTARAVQGLTGGLLVPLALSGIFKAFPEGQRGAAIGIFAIPLMAGPAFGPVLGGYILTAFDWRALFFINVPIGVAAVLAALRLLAPGKPESGVRLDVGGTLLSSLAFGCILYGLSQVGQDGWGSASVRALLGLGLLGLALLVGYEWRHADPLLDVRLFQLPQFLVANLVGWVSAVALNGAEFMLPLYLQNLRGLSALDTGVLLLPQGLALAVAAPIAGVLTDRLGARPVTLLGLVVLAFNTWQLSQLSLETAFGTVQWLLVVRGFALSLSSQPTQVVALGVVSEAQRTNASSLTTATRSVAASFGIALLSTVIQTQATVHTTTLSWQVRDGTAAGAVVSQVGAAFQATGMPAVAAQAAAIQTVFGAVARQGAVLAFGDAYWLTFLVALLTMVVALWLPGRMARPANAAIG